MYSKQNRRLKSKVVRDDHGNKWLKYFNQTYTLQNINVNLMVENEI